MTELLGRSLLSLYELRSMEVDAGFVTLLSRNSSGIRFSSEFYESFFEPTGFLFLFVAVLISYYQLVMVLTGVANPRRRVRATGE